MNSVVWSEHRLLQISLEQFVSGLGFKVAPLEQAEVAL